MGYSASAYKKLLFALLTPGRIFDRDPGSGTDQLMDGKAQEL